MLQTVNEIVFKFLYLMYNTPVSLTFINYRKINIERKNLCVNDPSFLIQNQVAHDIH